MNENLVLYDWSVDMISCDREQKDKVVIQALISKVKSYSAKQAIRTADELADLIIFHARVHENTKVMSQPWDM